MTDIVKSTISWDRYFLNIASEIAKKSKDPSTKVGCIIADNNNRIRAAGFNGFPTKIYDLKERYSDRDIKYRFISHAEINAICDAARSGTPIDSCKLYVSWCPCRDCAKSIIQSYITEIILDPSFKMDDSLYARWKGSIDDAMLMFKEANVIVRYAVD